MGGMSGFRRFFLRIGLPYGLPIAIGTSLSSYFAWYDFVLTALGCALAFAVPLAAVAEVFRRWITPGLAGRIGLACSLLLTALAVSDPLFLFVRDVPHGRFRRLADPPAPAVSMVVQPCATWSTRDRGEVAVATQGGRWYVWKDHGTLPGSWTAVPDSASIARIPIDSCTRRSSEHYRTPLKTGRIVSRGQYVEDHVDAGFHAHYLLMSDGSVWRWEDADAAYVSIAAYFLMMIITVVLVIVAYRETARYWRAEPA